MRILKLFLISFLVFFSVLTAVGLLFPANVQVSRAIDLPGYQRNFLLAHINDTLSQACWIDSSGQGNAVWLQTDTSAVWRYDEGTTLSWILHGKDGQITMQGHVEAQLGWLPWERFRSLLMEPRYGPWLEKRLERFKICLERSDAAQSP